MRGHHDIGGLPLGDIDRSEHDYAMWEKRVDAMMFMLMDKGVFTGDETRYAIETLGADDYAKLAYYERWIVSMVRVLLQRGVITTEEFGRKMAEIAARN